MDVASSSESAGGSCDSLVELNIKTLDSQIYSFLVDKNTLVSSFKEKIAEKIGLPVVQQRLIFRGKVLKDEHLLAEYHVENGHTLHLVERQPSQPQPSSVPSSGETNASNGSQGNDSNDGVARNRLGRISHSVVLGTFNVGEQGEGPVPDVTRVIGAVLNSLGIGNQNAANPGQNFTAPAASGQTSQGNGAAAEQGNNENRSQPGSSTQPSQSFPSQPFQFPLAGASFPLPSFSAPIPDSLSTLCDFINQMDRVLSRIGSSDDQSSDMPDQSPTVLPSNAAGLPTPEALGIVLRRAEQLLERSASASLSHIAGSLEQNLSSSDTQIRNQVQSELVQSGLAMQHLGALFLELGRTMLTLRMGQSPEESGINSGPAVYVSPQGPNPLMVQPFPLQTSPLFNSGSGVNFPPAPPTLGHIGVIGSAPRNVNIHIHAGTAFSPLLSAAGARPGSTGDTQGDRTGATVPGNSGTAHVLRNVTATAVPRPVGVSSAPSIGPSGISTSQTPDSSSMASMVAEISSQIRNQVANLSAGIQQSPSSAVDVLSGSTMGPAVVGVSTSQPPDASSLDSMVAEINAQIREQVGNSSAEIQQSPGMQEGAMQNSSSELDKSSDTAGVRETSETNISISEVQKVQSESLQEGFHSLKQSQASSSSSGTEIHDGPNAAKNVPLGLGLLGLQPKKRQQPSNVQQQNSSTSNQSPSTIAAGQQVLQSLASLSSSTVRNPSNEGVTRQMPQTLAPRMQGVSIQDQGSRSQQPDMMGLMSQVLDNPAFSGILSGIAGQTGVGSADDIRGMFQQLTQSPDARNSINQLAQQVSREDISSMFAGPRRGQEVRSQEGGMDFSSMFQQMMPIVSRALSGNSTQTDSFINVERDQQPERTSIEQESTVDIQEVVQRINEHSPPQAILRAIAQASLLDNESVSDALVDDLCADEDLANEFIKLLSSDLQRHFQDGSD